MLGVFIGAVKTQIEIQTDTKSDFFNKPLIVPKYNPPARALGSVSLAERK